MIGIEGAARLRIYCDEATKADGMPLFQALVERARQAGLAGATVVRGVVGFGHSRSVHRASILDLSFNLPLIVDVIDREAALRDFVASLDGIEDVGLVTLERLEVLHYGGSEPIDGTRSA